MCSLHFGLALPALTLFGPTTGGTGEGQEGARGALDVGMYEATSEEIYTER